MCTVRQSDVRRATSDVRRANGTCTCTQHVARARSTRVARSTRTLDLIRFGGRVNYVDLVSSSFVEESLQALGGVRLSIRRSLVAAGGRPVAI
jgi:hypothetical protein